MQVLESRIQKILKLEGLIAATFTSFNEDGSLNTSNIQEYADHLCKHGVKGIFLNGTTGESVSLSVKERKTALEKWASASKNRLTIIAQIGANCILEAKELALHAEQVGVDAIATIPPLYYRPNNQGELVDYLAELSSAAPETPLVYYHIPKLTNVHVSMTSFLYEAKKKVPNLCGAKYTSTDLDDLVRCQMKYKDQFKLMLGAEELILGVLPYEINTFIGITFNVFAPVITNIIKKYHLNDKDSALKYQNEIITILDNIMRHGSLVPVLKETMNILTGINVGNPRTPLFPIENSKKEALASTLKELGF